MLYRAHTHTDTPRPLAVLFAIFQTYLYSDYMDARKNRNHQNTSAHSTHTHVRRRFPYCEIIIVKMCMRFYGNFWNIINVLACTSRSFHIFFFWGPHCF